MVEEYLDGPQVSTESVVVDGRCFTPGFLRPQLRISRALCAVLHREWRRSAEPSAGGDAGEGQRRRGARGRRARHRQRHRQGRHRRPQGRALCDRAGGAAFRRLLLHARDSAQHRRRFRRRGDQDRAGRARRRRRTRAARLSRRSSSVTPFRSRAASSSVKGADEARNVQGVAELIVTAKPGDIIPPAGDKRPSAAMVLATGASRADGVDSRQRCAGAARRSKPHERAAAQARDRRPRRRRFSLFALFHLNLAFSSIEEEQRGEVIARCYWPLLRACRKRTVPSASKRPASRSRKSPRAIRPGCREAKRLIAEGRIELIGSGYAQIIGPLVPAPRHAKPICVSAMKSMSGFWDAGRQLALVNEQAYSAGLVGLYLDAGYRAILMDWDNPGGASPGMARRNALSCRSVRWARTAARSRFSGPTPSRSRNCSVLRMATSRSSDYRRLCRAASAAPSRARFAFMPAMRRFSISVPAAIAPKRHSTASEWARIGEAFAALSRCRCAASRRAERCARCRDGQTACRCISKAPPARCRSRSSANTISRAGR